MIRKSLVLLAVAALATPALAQQTPPRPNSPPPVLNPMAAARANAVPDRPTPAQEWDFRAYTTQGRAPDADTSPERVALANRISALVESGQCDAARAMARAEGDRQMALRVRQLCRPNNG